MSKANFKQQGELAAARSQPFEALSQFDRALAYYPDHSAGIVGVSNILMDIYEEKLPIEEPESSLPLPSVSTSQILTKHPVVSTSTAQPPAPTANRAQRRRNQKDPSPEQLNRLAARDRAYMLLSNLTRQGYGWNNSDAWYALARAHELSNQISKAKQALWWVVELEESRPVRDWAAIGARGLTL